MDAIVTPVRYDSTPHEPGKFVIHFDPISAIYVYSRRPYDYRICFPTCTGFFMFRLIHMRFSEVMCCDILISLLIVIIVLSLIRMVLSDSANQFMFRLPLSTLQHVFNIIMKQANRLTLQTIKSVNVSQLIVAIFIFFLALLSEHFFLETLFPTWKSGSSLTSLSVLLHDPKYSNMKPTQVAPKEIGISFFVAPFPVDFHVFSESGDCQSLENLITAVDDGWSTFDL